MSELRRAISRWCPMCGNITVLRLTEARRAEVDHHFEVNGLIQKDLPDFDPFEREFVKSGYCPECQIALFANHFADDKSGKWAYSSLLSDEEWAELEKECQDEERAVVRVLSSDKWKDRLSIAQKEIVLGAAMLSDTYYVDENGQIQCNED